MPKLRILKIKSRPKRKANVFLRKAALFFSRYGITENTVIIILAIIVGVLGGYGAVIFRKMIQFVQYAFYGREAVSFFTETINVLPWYRVFWVPALGGLVTGLLIYFFAKEAKGHGVPEVMAAVAINGGRIRPRVALFKSLASAVTIGTGGIVGREGPIVQIGSAIGSTVGQVLGMKKERLRTLVGCGAAAGIAATFNAPIAGVMFALEVIMMDFAVNTFSPIVISSVVATVISRAHLGDFPAFNVPGYELVSSLEIPLYAVMGLVIAGVSLFFVSTLYKLEDIWDLLKIPGYVKSMAGGLVLGLLAIKVPHVLGVDYVTIEKMIRGDIVWWGLVGIVLLKILGTSWTIGSGGSGGIFAPSLFIGCAAGGAFGFFAHSVFPSFTAHPGAYAIVGMGTLVAGATHAPITAIIILFEMTDDYRIILPLMVSCIVCTLITMAAREGNIYTVKLMRRGINLAKGKELSVLAETSVYAAMNKKVETVYQYLLLKEIKKQLSASLYTDFPVVDDKKRLVGFLSFQDYREYLSSVEFDERITAKDIADDNVVTVKENDNLKNALEILEENHIEQAPVVSRTGEMVPVGMISRGDIISTYNSVLKKKFSNRPDREKDK